MRHYQVAAFIGVTAMEAKVSVLFFSGETNGVEEKIQRIIDALVPKDENEIYRTIEGLSSRFRRPRGNLAVMILSAASQKDLLDLLLIRQLFDGIPMILIIPDREKDTIFKGRKLFPRFMSYADGSFADVAAVLEKMLNLEHGKKIMSRKEVKAKCQN